MKKKINFPQDFRALKILPSVVEKPEPDIEKIKKEEFIFTKQREDEKENLKTNHIDSAIETNEIDSVILTTLKPQTSTKIYSTSSIGIAPTIDIFTTATTNTHSEEQTAITQKVSIDSTTAEDYDDEKMITEHKDYEMNVTKQQNVPTTGIIYLHNDTDLITNEVDATAFSAINFDSPEKEKYGHGAEDDKSTDEDDKSNEEFYDSESDEENDINGNKRMKIIYKGKQHTLPSSTLLHGFIANPGYPAYYIGSERDCKWKIIIARGQKISLTILDLHLRSK